MCFRADDLLRRKGISEVMKARTAAGEDKRWLSFAKRNLREWWRNETEDRALILAQLEERVSDDFPRKSLLKHRSTG